MSVTSAKKLKRELKAQFKFEENPPRCSSCEHYQRQEYGGYAPTCLLGKFKVRSFSICDKWTSKTGETIEDSNQTD